VLKHFFPLLFASADNGPNSQLTDTNVMFSILVEEYGKMKAVKSAFTLAGAICLFSMSAAGQVAPLPVEDVVAMHSFSEWTPVRFSPDGAWMAYAAKDNRRMGLDTIEQFPLTGVPLNGLGADIYVVRVMTGKTTNLTGGTGNNWAPAWSPDGHYLAFLSDRDGSGQAKLWILEVATGKMRKVSEISARAIEIHWLPNNREVLLTALPKNLTPKQFAERAVSNSVNGGPSEAENRVSGSTVVLYRSESNGPQRTSKTESAWNLDGWLRDLVLVDVDDGKAPVIDHGHRITKVALSPDGSQVAVTIPKRFEKAGSPQILFDLNVYSLGNGEARTLASDILLYSGGSFNWSPDSSQLAYQTGGMEATGDCYLVGLRGGTIKNISNLQARPNQRAYPPVWDAEGRHVYFLHEDAIWKAAPDGETATRLAKIPHHRIFELVARQGVAFSPDNARALLVLTYDDELKRSGFYKVNLETGESVKLREKSQWYFTYSREDNISVSPDGKVLAFFLEDAQHAQELWLASQNFQNERRLTDINPQLDKYQMGSARLVGWQGLDGEQLHGALLLPAGYMEGKSYPLIVCVYGGASLSNNLVQFGLGLCGIMNMQLFATRGYAVLLPDAPQRLGTPMADLANTILPGVNKVIEMGIGDPNRLGVMGHSYGGYSVLSLIVQAKRFKAGVMAGGYGNIMAHYGEMGKDGSTYAIPIAEQGQELMGGTPWQLRDRYIENSPVFYLDRVDTPLLIVHGAEDNAVASFLADEVFVGLRRLGKEVVYAKYEKESHSPQTWSYANRLDFCNRVIAWFDVHLKR
jgi:dipeptidyl aminopeptidase/acylaminoacyl peptidase